jgi:hypothetical protein
MEIAKDLKALRAGDTLPDSNERQDNAKSGETSAEAEAPTLAQADLINKSPKHGISALTSTTAAASAEVMPSSAQGLNSSAHEARPERAIYLRWVLRDIAANRWHFLPASPSDLEILVERQLVEMRGGVPHLTEAGARSISSA